MTSFLLRCTLAPTPDIDSIAGRDVRRCSEANHESRITCLLNNVVFRTLPRESARSALRWLPPASLARVCLALAIFTVATAAGSHAQTASPRKGSHAQTASPRKGSHAQTASPRKGSHAQTASPPKERAAAVSAVSRPGGEPIMAIVSLRSQRIIVYDSAH